MGVAGPWTTCDGITDSCLTCKYIKLITGSMLADWSRRKFIKASGAAMASYIIPSTGSIMTVNGKLPNTAMGISLIHEHILVDFIGADKINSNRWNKEEVIGVILPYLTDLKKYGVNTFIDCTPAFLGRDVALLKELSIRSGLQIMTNTGYYGAVGNKYLPAWARTASANQLAQTWVKEFKDGVDNTKIKPGFIKIGVDPGPLSDLHKKLITAAGLTHKRTGLTICSHTGPAIPALEQIEVLKSMHIHPSAMVWTHAQNESDVNQLIKGARSGAWVSLDGLGWGEPEKYLETLIVLKSANLLPQVLISHDAGWYKPGEVSGGKINGYTRIFEEFIPLLKQKGFGEDLIHQLLVINPMKAFTIAVKKA